MKNIILCSDGTGNSGGKARGTNVWRVFTRIDRHDHLERPELPQQIAFYDDGVGTSSFRLFKILGGAFGWGLSRNVRQLYKELVRIYRPGDRIYCFGFSRGAFTIRTLVGMITECGVVDPRHFTSNSELERAVRHTYRCHREHYAALLTRGWRWLSRRLLGRSAPEVGRYALRNEDQSLHIPRIAFVGVWDTVDAVGLPFDEAARFLNAVIHQFKFPEYSLSPRVEKACHALAIDDERQTFHPLIWDESNESGDRLEQVWFAGVHSNVGGGYPKDGLALISLDWILGHAEKAGLRISQSARAALRERSNIFEKLYDSRAGLAGFYRFSPRRPGWPLRQATLRRVRVHHSVLQRIRAGTLDYAPGNLPSELDIIDARGMLSAELDQLALTQALQEDLSRSGSPLQIVAGWNRLRRVAHAGLVLSTLALAGLLLAHWNRPCPENAQLCRQVDEGSLPLAGPLEEGLRAMLAQPLSLLIAGLAILALFLGWFGRRKVQDRHSRFWRRVLRRLDETVDPAS